MILPVNKGNLTVFYDGFEQKFQLNWQHKFDFSHFVPKFGRFCDEEKSNFLIKNIVYDPQGTSPKGAQ